MKKATAIILVLVLVLAVITGCSKGNDDPGTAPPDSSASTPPVSEINPADDWPNKAINMIIPAQPGGDTDFNGRAYATYLEGVLGVPVVVTNVDGASNTLACRQVYDADPDGYTLLTYHDGIIFNHFNGLIDFCFDGYEMGAVLAMDTASLVLTVNASSPYETLEDLINASKAKPGTITISAQAGGLNESWGYQLNAATDAEFLLVDGGGNGARIADILGGNVEGSMLTLGGILDYLESGDFRALAIASEERNEMMPDVPTFKELGIDMVGLKPYYFMFPKSTPAEIVEKFNAACQEVAYNNADYQALVKDGAMLDPYCLGVQESIDMANAQFDMYQEIYDTYIKAS